MIKLENYILENARSTTSNKQRKEELEKYLKGKNYPDYVETLNKMLDDPKAKTLLEDGFGGELGDTKFVFSVKNISPKVLRPTQNEIDVDKSIKHALTKPNNLKNDFSKEVIIANMPLVTFRGNYVIDGHHRWAEGAMINPDGKMVCFDYDANISPIQMLKAVQGNIAAALAQREGDQDIPSGKTAGPNLYDKEWNENKIREYIKGKLTDECEKELSKHIDTYNTVDYLVENIMSVKNNNYPEDNAPSRGEMPQTDKAGTETGNKRSSYPDKDGSALNRMANGKFDKNAVK
jgi:hypothetical protein